MIPWRTIEAAVCDILREDGFDLDEDTKSGDKFIAADNDVSDLNITLFAQELAKRLLPKAKVAP